MSKQTPYYVILFKSVSYALKAEQILKAEGIPHKLIPVPERSVQIAACACVLKKSFRIKLKRHWPTKCRWKKSDPSAINLNNHLRPLYNYIK